MQRIRAILIGTLTALLPLGACTESPDPAPTPASEPVEVTIGAASGIGIEVESRTQIDDAGEEVRWSGDDRMALWARSADGSWSLEKAEFALWHFSPSWQGALFRGTVTPMDEAAAYTYYAVCPVPAGGIIADDAAAADGAQRVAYELPAVQDGAFHGEWDVMVADPLPDAPGLVAGDNSQSVSLDFHHQVHLLRIRIPQNNLGEAITKLTLTFPTDVTGTLSVDLTDPQARPQISGSPSVTLQFAEPKNAGDVVFATIAPVSLTASDAIEIVAEGPIYRSQARTIAGKEFLAGHTTPIAYTVPEAEATLGTRLRFTLQDTGEATLGEPIQRLWFEAEGVTFDEGSAANPFTVTPEGVYEMLLPSNSEVPGQLNAAGKLTICYDSEHATVTREISLGTITPLTVNEIALSDVPYLLEEDFGDIQGFEIDSDNGTGATSGGSNSASDLTKYGLEGWTGARCGVSAGKSLRICSRNECAAQFYGSYHGRLDTRDLLALKSSCRIVVRFSYSMARSSNQGNTLQPYLAAGITSDNSRDAASTTWYSDPGTILQHNIRATIYDITDSGALNGDYDNIALQTEYTVTASSTDHLVWEVYMKQSEPKEWFTFYYSNNWVYLDNIRVSIVPQQ